MSRSAWKLALALAASLGLSSVRARADAPAASAPHSAAAVEPVGPATPAAPSAAANAPSPGRYADLRPITFAAINSREQVTARLYRDDGTIDPAVLARLAQLFRDGPTEQPSPLVPRTMQLLVRIATHFSADRIEVVSAFRTGRSSSGRRVRREGYHGVGSAIDFRLPNVPVEEVAAYARTLSHVGVGCYPSLGFVHLDSREQTFFWENAAGRRRRGWNRPLDRAGVAERERSWNAADDAPWDPPGSFAILDLHPRTAPGAHHARRATRSRGHHAHGSHGSRHRHSRRRVPLRVFQGSPR